MQSFPDLSLVFFDNERTFEGTIVDYFLHHFRAFNTQACVFWAKLCHATTKS